MEKRIEISVGFAAMLCVLGWADLGICGYFLLAMLLHEVAHVLAMALFGIQICGISLKLSGAVIRCGCCSYRQEAVCAAAGPAASVIFGFAVLRVNPQLALISFLLGAGNMFPIYPLDGGRFLRAVLLEKRSETFVIALLARVTRVTCCLLMVGACWWTVELQAGLWPVFAALAVLWRVGTVVWHDQ